MTPDAHGSMPAERTALLQGSRLPAGAPLYAPPPSPGAPEQIAALRAAGHEDDANAIERMIETPQAVWFTRGDPGEVELAVRATVAEAGATGSIPILVAYNVPGRDCSQYSSGGSPTGDAYRAWIEAFARGLGDANAVVIVEPDGLALMPADCSQADAYDRTALVDYAAHALLASPNAAIYLDAGNSGWHPAAEMAARLVAAGVANVNGFALNVSNYHRTENEIRYGTEVAAHIASIQGRAASSASHFVIDTSRNSRGPWTPPENHPTGDPQVWCNPPDRGLGARPTLDTGVPSVDAYLWIKIPGESDGEGFRWTDGPIDPVRGGAAPAAGRWFPDMALELVRNAAPI